MRLRADDARALGKALQKLYDQATRLATQVKDGEAAANYLHIVALLPFEVDRLR